jgi:predicted Ser/Thr protein kinase
VSSLGYEDVILGRLLLQQGAVTPQGLWAALRRINESADSPALGATLAQIGMATPQAIEQVKAQIAQVKRAEVQRALARLLYIERLVFETALRSIFSDLNSSGFHQSLGERLVAEGYLTRSAVAELEARSTETLEEQRRSRGNTLVVLTGGLTQLYDADVAKRVQAAFNLAGALSADAEPEQAQPPPPTGLRDRKTEPMRVLVKTDPLATLKHQVPDLAPEDCPIYGYEIVEELGKGSMGVVYKARHIFTDRMTALKILPLRLSAKTQNLERFKREAMALMRLNHDNVVRAYDFGGSEEYYYLALEYIEGETLEAVLDREGHLDERRALGIVRQVALGLGCAAERGIVHRDIKPENVMLTADGTAKICDFGIVKLEDLAEDDGGLTIAGTTVGTPFYISPEQARGDETLDSRSDIYSLGISLYHLTTGQVPFTGKSQGAILVRHILEEVPDPRVVRPELSEDLAAIVRRMTRKQPEDRYPSTTELVLDIEQALNGA